MITNLRIENFRQFEKFDVDGLAQVNLLVGKNNSGKTSVLEAAAIVASNGDPEQIVAALRRRGEALLLEDGERPRRGPIFDVGCLFRNHEISPGSEFRIYSIGGIRETVTCRISADGPKSEADQLFISEEPFAFGGFLSIDSKRKPKEVVIRLLQAGGLDYNLLLKLTRVPDDSNGGSVHFLTTEIVDTRSLARLWNPIALTSDEEKVLSALRILDPRVERIAFLVSDGPFLSAKIGGIVVKLSGREYPMPLGSMGDGMRRLLALALSVIRSKEGLLLVDEIDTGFHYSVLTDLWRLVIRTASRLGVQVIATTHSEDCVKALARVVEDDHLDTEVALHRVEADASSSIRYSASQISEATQRDLEVR